MDSILQNSQKSQEKQSGIDTLGNTLTEAQQSYFADELERNIKMLEDYVKQVYNSWETKKTAENGYVKYSIIKTSKMPYPEQLQLIEKRQINGSNSLYIGEPSQQLQKVGLSEAPFAMNQSDYRKSRRAFGNNKNYSSHAVPYEFFENMPQYFADAPLLIDKGNKVSIITLYPMNDTKGQASYVIGGVWQNQQMENDTVNLVKSVYPLDDFVSQIAKAAETGSLVIINKNKAEQMLATIGIQPSKVSHIVSLSKHTISQKAQSVNTGISENGPAYSDSFINRDTYKKAAESGGNSLDLGLSEPAITDIAHVPTAEESIAAAISGEQLDIKQRRILDFAEKHFPHITVKFSGNMTKNCLWDSDSKTLLLNINQTVAGMYTEVFKHEFMHILESKRLYQEFKQFLFNKDTTFGVWAKVQCKTHGIELSQNATAKEAINALCDYCYTTVKNDMTIAKKYRDAFTVDGAQREMVADFFGEIMFNGKKYRTQTAQALADETFLTLFDKNEIAEFEANSMAALAEISENEPNIFKQIVDWVKRLILKLRGTRIKADAILADELERNIKMLEDYVKQIYNSRDTKKIAENGSGVSYEMYVINITETDIKHNIEEITKMKSVSTLTGREFAKGEKNLLTQLDEYFSKFGYSVENDVIGDVDITVRGVKDSIAHGIGRNKAIAFSAVPDVIEKGKIIDYQKNWKGRQYDTIVLAAPITIENTPYYEGVIILRDNKTQRFYLHEVITEKRTDMPFKTGADNKVGNSGGISSPSIISLLQKLQIVKESLTNKSVEVKDIPHSDEVVDTKKSNDDNNDNPKFEITSQMQQLRYNPEAYYDKLRSRQAFDVDLSQIEERYLDTYKKAAESGVLNDTKRTHELVDMIAKISADKGVRFDFVNNEKISKSGFAADDKIVNGYLDEKGNIVINIDSSKALESTVGHEITHILEGTELYAKLETAITEYAIQKGEYDNRLAALTELYKNVEGADVSKELVADLVGDYLFNDSEFIRRLSTEHRNIFEKIFDEIKYMLRIVTAGSKEARQLEKIKKAFENAYRESGKVQKNTAADGGVKYSFAGYAEDGKGMYKSNFPKGTPKIAKAQRILSYIQDVWSKKPIKLNITDNEGNIIKTIDAQFDPTYENDTKIVTDASKLMGGNRHGSASEQRVTLDLADDYYQIASESKYNYSKSETGKNKPTHDGVREWHYFANDIYFAEYDSNVYKPYTVSINVKEKPDGNFVYSFSAEKQKENSTQQTLHAVVSEETPANAKLFKDIISEDDMSVNTSISENFENDTKNILPVKNSISNKKAIESGISNNTISASDTDIRYSDRDSFTYKEYNRLIYKKPIKVSKQDWVKVNSRRTQKYAHISDENVPVLDLIKLAEYNRNNEAYGYVIRNIDKYSFSIISKMKVISEKSQVLNERKEIYDSIDRQNVGNGNRDGFDRRSSESARYGGTIRENASEIRQSSESEYDNHFGYGASDSRRGIGISTQGHLQAVDNDNETQQNNTDVNKRFSVSADENRSDITPETSPAYSGSFINRESDSVDNTINKFTDEKIDFVNNVKYNNKRGENYVRTDEFRSLQAESQRMSDEDSQLYHSGERRIDSEVRGRLSGAFRLELRPTNSKRIYSVRTLLNPKTNNNVNIIEGVDGSLFHDIFEISRKYLKNGELVDLHKIETTEYGIGYNDCYNYLSEDGLSGFSITPDGDLISVFNLSAEKGFLKTIAPIVTEKAKTLDCYASPKQNLMTMYERIFGFKTASVMDYNMEYDHDNIAKNHNKPQVAFMVNTDADVKTRYFTETQYDEAKGYRDSFVNKKTDIDSSISIGTRKNSGSQINFDQKKAIEKLSEKLGRKVEFEDLRSISDSNGNTVSPYGYIKDGVIHLNLYAENPIGFIFKHELTHFGENTSSYARFKQQFKNSKLYKNWLCKKTGESDVKIAEYIYKKRVVAAQSEIYSINDPKVEAEIISDFVGDMLFTENGSGMASIVSDMNVKHRNAFVQFIIDFVSYIKKKISGQSFITFQLSVLEDSFNRMISEASDLEKRGIYNYGNGVSYCFAVCKDSAKIGMAEKLEGSGVDYKSIFLQTGLIRDPFGYWLFEMDTSYFRIYHDANAGTVSHYLDYRLKWDHGVFNCKLGDIVSYKELYDNYPQLKELKVIIQDSSNPDDTIRYIPGRKALVINKRLWDSYETNKNEFRAIMMSALQRLIQYFDGRNSNIDFDTLKEMEANNQLPYTDLYGRSFTAEEAQQYIFDNYEADMVEKRQRAKDSLLHPRTLSEIQGMDEYLPIMDYDNVIVPNGEGRLVTLKGEISQKQQNYINQIANRFMSGDEINLSEVDSIDEVLGFDRCYIPKSRSDIENSPNRNEMRRGIVKRLLKHGSAVIGKKLKAVYNGFIKKERRADIVLGLPSSSPSTGLVTALSAENSSRIIDENMVKEWIPEYDKAMYSEAVLQESSLIADEIMEISVEKGENIVKRIIADNYKAIVRLAEYLKSKGYTVYIHLDETPTGAIMGEALKKYLNNGEVTPMGLIARCGEKAVKIFNRLIKNENIADGYTRSQNYSLQSELSSIADKSAVDSEKGQNTDKTDNIYRETEGIENEDTDTGSYYNDEEIKQHSEKTDV